MFSKIAPRSLASRLTVLYTGSALAIVFVGACILYWGLRSSLVDEDDDFLRDRLASIQRLVEQDENRDRELRWEVEAEWGAGQINKVYLRLLDHRGRIFMESPGMGAELPTAVFVSNGTIAAATSATGRPYRLLSKSIYSHSLGTLTIQAAIDQASDEAILSRYRTWMFFVLFATSGITALIGLRIARSGTQPVRDIAAMVRGITTRRLQQRIPEGTLPTELRELAATLNGMLSNLEFGFARLERYSADIAHELRTPLNNLRGETEVALGRTRSQAEYRDVLESNLEEYDRLAKMVDSLLFLARSEKGHLELEAGTLNAHEELRKLHEFFEPLAGESGIHLILGDSAAHNEFRADRTLFQRAVSNLIGNALRHTRTGGTVEISARASNGFCGFSVRDTGEGIAREDLPHVFERFYRADPLRGGAGLGLAIARAIAEAHGGAVSLDSTVGHGTTATITFPT